MELLQKVRPARVAAIDVARALAIIGVVLNHTIDGLVSSNIADPLSPVAQFNSALYIFRMPALAFLLGLFIPRAIEKRGVPGYLRERVTFALYLYVVWFVIQSLLEITTSSLKNTPRGWDSLLEIWSMPAHLWFLPYIALSTIVVTLVAPWRNRARLIGGLLALVALSIASWGWVPDLFGMRGLSLLAFTAAGAAIGMVRISRWATERKAVVVAIGAAAIPAFVVLNGIGMVPGTASKPATYGLGSDWMIHPISILGAVIGVVALFGLAVVLARLLRVGGWLSIVGLYTLEIYLAHVAVVAGCRIFLQLAGVESVLVFLFAALIFGLGAPLVLAKFAPRLRLGWLFKVPGALGHWSRAANKY